MKELTRPLRHFIAEIEELNGILWVASRSLKATQAMPGIAAVLVKIKDDEVSRAAVIESEKAAEIAKREIDEGFPFLYSQASLMMYAHLEGAIKRFITLYFKGNNLESIKEVATLKVQVGEFTSLDEDEKYDLIFQLYERSVASGIQYGVTRFETLLSPIGFAGSVKESTSKSLFELSQVRNCILHRGGVVDRHLIAACPWLQVAMGSKVRVDRQRYSEYYQATIDYATTLAIRLAKKLGIETEEPEELM